MTRYRIELADGRTPPECRDMTYAEALDWIESRYPDADIGHDGDLAEHGDRTLFWASTEDAKDDSGARAVGAILPDAGGAR